MTHEHGSSPTIWDFGFHFFWQVSTEEEDEDHDPRGQQPCLGLKAYGLQAHQGTEA